MELEDELLELDDGVELLLEELEPAELSEDELLELGLGLDAELSLEEDELPEELSGSVGLPPPQAVKPPTPTRAAPPESRIRKSRRSVL